MSDATAAPAIPMPSTSPLVAFADAAARKTTAADTAAPDWALAAIESGHAGEGIDTMRAEHGPDGAPTATSDLVALPDEGDFFADAGDAADGGFRHDAFRHDAAAMAATPGEGEAGIPMAAGAGLDFPRHGVGLDWTDADPLGIG